MCDCKDCALCAGVRVFMHVDARSECPVCSIEAGLPESGAHRCSAGLKASNCPVSTHLGAGDTGICGDVLLVK